MVSLGLLRRVAVAIVIVLLASCASSPATPSPSAVTTASSSPVAQSPPTSAPTSTPSPVPTATPTPVPTPTPTPDPFGLELRDRIVSFAAAASRANGKMPPTIPQPLPGQREPGVIQMAAATKGLNPIRRRIEAEQEWLMNLPMSGMCTTDASGKETCEQHSPMPSFKARTEACSLYGVWQQALRSYSRAIVKVVGAAQRQTQGKLDRARADAKSAAARLKSLAAAVKTTPDPCAVAELP